MYVNEYFYYTFARMLNELNINPLIDFGLVLPEIELSIVQPGYCPPWLLSLKIGPDLWTITREQCIGFFGWNSMKLFNFILNIALLYII
jgi:hypothetical protein